MATQLAIAIQSTLFEQAQTELAEAQAERKRNYANKLPANVATDAILVRDLENKILFWNRGAEHLYGGRKMTKARMPASFYKASLQLKEALKTVVLTGEWYGEL